MADTPILIVAEDGRIVDANKAATAALGSCVGRRCADVVRAKDRRGRSPCSLSCSGNLIASGEHIETLGTTRGRRPNRVVCEALGDHVVVLLHPAPSVLPEGSLTEREHEVLGLVAKGLTGQRIARRLGVSVWTARSHVQNIREKLGVHTRAEAVALAKSLGWLSEPE